jgi:radical SAM protein with 4Fe4S-binding SPASM domain
MNSSPISEQPYSEFSRRIWDQSAQRDHPLPTRVQFEITYRCNIHCVHCYTDPFNTPGHLRRELTVDQMLELFDPLAEAGVLWMLLTGGEALVHPQFKRIYREAKQRGFIVSLFSNGTTVTENLADFLAADPPFQIEVSCHGATPNTFEKITQVPGSFQRFEEGVRRLLERGLPLKIKTKGMTLNRGELPQIKRFVEGLGLDFRLYTRIYPRLDGDLSSTQYRLPAPEILDLEFGDALGPVESEDEEDRCVSGQFGPPPDDRLFRCGCGTNSITISPYGILRACTFTTWPAYDLKEMPLREAFGRLVQEIRQARYTGISPCRSCVAYSLCDKNPVMALAEAGSMEAPVPDFCETAFGRKEKLEKEMAHGAKK